MSRYYFTLECGCMVSCDGGGGLYPCGHHWDNPRKSGDPLDTYYKEHIFCAGYCKVCNPQEYREALQEELHEKLTEELNKPKLTLAQQIYKICTSTVVNFDISKIIRNNRLR